MLFVLSSAKSVSRAGHLSGPWNFLVSAVRCCERAVAAVVRGAVPEEGEGAGGIVTSKIAREKALGVGVAK